MNNAFYFGFFPRFFSFFWGPIWRAKWGLGARTHMLRNFLIAEWADYVCSICLYVQSHFEDNHWRRHGRLDVLRRWKTYIFLKSQFETLSLWAVPRQFFFFVVVVRLHIILAQSAPLFEDMDEKQNAQQPSSLSCKGSQSCTFCSGLASGGVKLCLRQLVPTQIRWLLMR